MFDKLKNSRLEDGNEPSLTKRHLGGIEITHENLPLCECGCGQNSKLGNRFIRGHSRRIYHPSDPLYIVDPITGCWIWQRKLYNGYGRYSFNGVDANAHRSMYLAAGRTIPKGYALDHLCCNPACVNPDHLEPVTQAENNRRAAKHRALKKKLAQSVLLVVT